jgi:N-acetylmuramoyl-L-alanine amidase
MEMWFIKRYAWVYLLAVLGAWAFSSLLSGGVRLAAQVTAMTEPKPMTIVLDPGHGGADGGAVSCSGALESGLNLEISLRLNDLLHLAGYRTRMTRSTDVSIHSPEAQTVSERKISDLRNRVALVNETDHALLISIHQNFFEQPKYHGAQVFYAPERSSEELAEAMQAALSSCLDPDNHRAAKPDRTVYLLQNVHCPAALIECGFLSNPPEEQRLHTAQYQKQIACAVLSGLCDYLAERTDLS